MFHGVSIPSAPSLCRPLNPSVAHVTPWCVTACLPAPGHTGTPCPRGDDPFCRVGVRDAVSLCKMSVAPPARPALLPVVSINDLRHCVTVLLCHCVTGLI